MDVSDVMLSLAASLASEADAAAMQLPAGDVESGPPPSLRVLHEHILAAHKLTEIRELMIAQQMEEHVEIAKQMSAYLDQRVAKLQELQQSVGALRVSAHRAVVEALAFSFTRRPPSAPTPRRPSSSRRARSVRSTLPGRSRPSTGIKRALRGTWAAPIPSLRSASTCTRSSWGS